MPKKKQKEIKIRTTRGRPKGTAIKFRVTRKKKKK